MKYYARNVVRRGGLQEGVNVPSPTELQQGHNEKGRAPFIPKNLLIAACRGYDSPISLWALQRRAFQAVPREAHAALYSAQCMQQELGGVKLDEKHLKRKTPCILRRFTHYVVIGDRDAKGHMMGRAEVCLPKCLGKQAPREDLAVSP